MKLHVYAVLAASVALAACSGSRQEVRDSDAAARGTTPPAVEAPASAEQEAAKSTPLSSPTAEQDMFGDREANKLLRVHFPFDSAELTTESQETLKKNAEFLRNNPEARIVIEGHTDERGTADYNLALGEKRAKSVRQYLTLLGIDASRMDTVSYGSEQPLVDESGEDAWSQNRRAQFREL